jgi:hypothetical protein
MNKQRVGVYTAAGAAGRQGAGQYLAQDGDFGRVLDTAGGGARTGHPRLTRQMQRLFGIDPVKAGVDFQRVSYQGCGICGTRQSSTPRKRNPGPGDHAPA